MASLNHISTLFTSDMRINRGTEALFTFSEHGPPVDYLPHFTPFSRRSSSPFFALNRSKSVTIFGKYSTTSSAEKGQKADSLWQNPCAVRTPNRTIYNCQNIDYQDFNTYSKIEMKVVCTLFLSPNCRDRHFKLPRLLS